MVGLWRQLLMGLLLLGSAILIFIGLASSRPEPEEHVVEERSWPVAAMLVSPATHNPTLTLYGRVNSSHVVELRSGVEGFVTERGDHFVVGGIVRQNEILLLLDQELLTLDLNQARADLAAALAREAELQAIIEQSEQLLMSDRNLLELTESRLARQQRLRQQKRDLARSP